MDNMQLWLSSSTDSINLNDSAEGFYLNPDLEGLTGLPEIRSVNGLNAGYDGGWTATQLWAARLITIRGVIAINDKAAVETKRKALAKLLAQGKSEDLELRFISEAGNTYTTTVRTTGCTMALQRVFWRQEYQIQLRANDPLIYDDGGSELVAILRVMAGEGGFEIPFDIPFTIGGSIEPTSVDVGDEATYPLIRLKGDLHNPTIISMTTNQRMQVLADIITTVEWRDYTTTYTTNGFAQISDGLDGAPLSLTHLYGNATQETIAGKNLLKVETGTHTSGGIDWTVTEDTITLSGTASGTSSNGSYFTLPTPIPAGVYRLTLPQALPYRIGVQTIEPDTTAHPSFLTVNASATTNTGTSTWTTARARIAFSGWTADDTINFSFPNRVMFSAGSEVEPYEPYVGGVPSPNPDYPQDVNIVSGRQTVKITGKNLWGIESEFDKTNATVVFKTMPDGTIEMSGTATATAYSMTSAEALASGNYVVLDAGEYTISQEGAPSYNVRACVMDIDANTNLSQYVSTDRLSVQFTIDHTVRAIVRLRIASGATTDSTVKMMLVKGSTAQDFEPYQAQSYEVFLGSPSVWDFTTLIEALSSVNVPEKTASSIVIEDTGASGNQSARYQITGLDASAKYSLSGVAKKLAQSTGGDHRIGVAWAGSNDGTTWSSQVVVFLQPYDVGKEQQFDALLTGFSQYRVWFINNSSNTATGEKTRFYDVKLRENSLELLKIGTYQDYIYNDNGTWKIHKAIGKVVLDGSDDERWGVSVSGTPNFFYTHRDVAPFTQVLSALSNYFTRASVASNNTVVGFCPINTTQLRFRPNFAELSIADWRTWLSTHNTTAYYALATPTDTEITDSELIEQLNHIYELYQGQNNLWLIPSAGAQGEMEVSYATTEDIDYHEVVIDCQARTVTQDGHNLYPALAEGSEFIRLLPGENKLYLTSEVESDNGTAEVKFKKGNISI